MYNFLYGSTCADEVPALSVAEVVEDLVSVGLGHSGVDEEAGVAQLGDLLGQQLHTLHRVAEDDALVDLELHAHTKGKKKTKGREGERGEKDREGKSSAGREGREGGSKEGSREGEKEGSGSKERRAAVN